MKITAKVTAKATEELQKEIDNEIKQEEPEQATARELVDENTEKHDGESGSTDD